MAKPLSALAMLVKKIEIETSPPDVRQNILYTDAMESTAVSEWIGSMSKWEESLDEYQVRSSRHEFMSEMLKKGLPVDVMDSYKLRWESANFTIVLTNIVGIDNVWAYVDPKHTLQLNKERDLISDYAKEGRTDMTLMHLQQYSWGTGSDDYTLLGVRGKIPGTRYLKIGRKMIGDEEFAVPEDFPVNVAERFGEKYYIIHPIACPGFSYMGRKFERHPYYAPSEFVAERWHEGIMLLTNKGEMRSKYLPTVDQEIDGAVWECAYSNGPVKIRPRPGKLSQGISQIFNAVVPKPVLMKDSHALQRVVEITVDRFTTGRYAKNNVMYLDSGLRMDLVKGYPVRIDLVNYSPEVKEMVVTTTEGPIIVKNARDVRRQLHKGTYKKQILGAKVLLLDTSGRRAYFIKEPTKSVDFVGGKLEFGETPDQALFREILEETGMHYTANEVISLGYSDAEDDEAFYRSYIYLARGRNWGEDCVTRMLTEAEEGDNVPWFHRLMGAVFTNRTISMLNDLLLQKEGKSTGELCDAHEVVLMEGKIREGKLRSILQRRNPKITLLEVDHWAKMSNLMQKNGAFVLASQEVPTYIKPQRKETVPSVRERLPEGAYWRKNFPYTNPVLIAAGDQLEIWVDRYVHEHAAFIKGDNNPASVVASIRVMRAQELSNSSNLQKPEVN